MNMIQVRSYSRRKPVNPRTASLHKRLEREISEALHADVIADLERVLAFEFEPMLADEAFQINMGLGV